jgi:hypothetical protein
MTGSRKRSLGWNAGISGHPETVSPIREKNIGSSTQCLPRSSHASSVDWNLQELSSPTSPDLLRTLPTIVPDFLQSKEKNLSKVK